MPRPKLTRRQVLVLVGGLGWLLAIVMFIFWAKGTRFGDVSRKVAEALRSGEADTTELLPISNQETASGDLANEWVKRAEAAEDDATKLLSYIEAGAIYNSLEDWQKSVEVLNKAAAIEPENIAMAKLLAEAYEKLGDNQKAVQYYQIVVDSLEKTPEEARGAITQEQINEYKNKIKSLGQ